jgi:ubiquinone/menaquinone biosynthesis C-methylase UbiE
MSQEPEKQVGQMGSWARYYDFLMALMTFGREGKLRQGTVELARLEPGDKVLEIGCGTGSLSLAAKRRVGASGEVVGLDLAPEMVAVASRKAKRKGADVSFLQGSIAEVPFPENRFDVVMCSFMIFHMPEDVRKKGLQEILRVLRPGGHLFILDAALPDKPPRRPRPELHDVRELVPVLSQLSFSEVETKETEFALMGTRFWFIRAKAAKA